jgi:hypothetical protein
VSIGAACRREVSGKQEAVRQQLAQQQQQQQVGPLVQQLQQLQQHQAKLLQEDELLGVEQVQLYCSHCVCWLLRSLSANPAMRGVLPPPVLVWMQPCAAKAVETRVWFSVPQDPLVGASAHSECQHTAHIRVDVSLLPFTSCRGWCGRT